MITECCANCQSPPLISPRAVNLKDLFVCLDKGYFVSCQGKQELLSFGMKEEVLGPKVKDDSEKMEECNKLVKCSQRT